MAMSTKKTYVELFNAKVEEFIRELTTSFPDIKQFSSFKAGFHLLKNLDVTKPVDIFDTYVCKTYKNKIIEKDETFFLTNEVDLTKTSYVDYWQDFIENIRLVWKELDNDEKDVIWKYFHILIVLNDKVNNANKTNT